MNELTHKIKSKGYKLNEFIKLIGISLSTYRKYEKEDHPQHKNLIFWIDAAKHKL